MEALISIALGAGIKYLTVESQTNRAFLQDTNEITFSNEDMEVVYLDHRRPFYLAASINQIPIKKNLVDMGASVNLIPLNTLQVARIPEKKILVYSMKVIGFEGKEYIIGYIQLWLKVGLVASLARFHMVKTKVSYHILLGRPWLYKHRLIPSSA